MTLVTSLDELKRLLDEDYGRGDRTSESVIPKGVRAKGMILAKDDAIIAGIAEVSTLLKDLRLDVNWKVSEGSSIHVGETIAEVLGDARALLSVERVVLNILGHMSGIATSTRKAIEIVNEINPSTRVAATRKTTPGIRVMEKRAVSIGGGDPHRFDLSEMTMIKDNHITLMGGIAEVIGKLRESKGKTETIEVEVKSVKEALEASKLGANIIMLDNMSIQEVRSSIAQLKEHGLREKVTIEASGGITFENLRDYASTGVDIISMGILTHSSPNIDISMNILKHK